MKNNIKQKEIKKPITIKSDWDIRNCFERLRFNENNHLGLGDIRLTIAQQEEICYLVERFYSNKNNNRNKMSEATTFGRQKLEVIHDGNAIIFGK